MWLLLIYVESSKSGQTAAIVLRIESDPQSTNRSFEIVCTTIDFLSNRYHFDKGGLACKQECVSLPHQSCICAANFGDQFCYPIYFLTKDLAVRGDEGWSATVWTLVGLLSRQILFTVHIKCPKTFSDLTSLLTVTFVRIIVEQPIIFLLGT
jgi:hypothetical protein